MPPKKQSMHESSPLWPEVDERLKKEVAKRKPKPAEVERIAKIADLLAEEFPDAFCALNFKTPFQLLIATILSAQCTDVRVNMVTPDLFKKYKTPKALAAAPQEEVEEVIRTTGFYKNKAKAIRETARMVDEDFGGKLPRTLEKIQTLRGAARKTANVVRMHGFDLPGLSVDTHFSRITQRLELTTSTDAEKIEFDIAAMLPPERWTHFADAVILHGRKTCNARKPKCGECCIAELCPSAEIPGEEAAAPKPKKKPAAGKKKPKA